MTYGEVLLWLVVPPILFMARPGWSGLRRYGLRGRLSLPALALIAFVYAAPWDNYLIWRGVWDSPPDRIVGRLFFVPVEEYAFFILQPLLTGLWFGAMTRLFGLRARPEGSNLGAFIWILILVSGALLWARPGSLYLGALLTWAALPLAGMWWYRGGWFVHNWPVLSVGVMLPTLYLWWVDRLAIAEGAWSLSPDHTLGVAPWGLPLEEALFFLFTNMLVVGGIGLFIEPALGAGDLAEPHISQGRD